VNAETSKRETIQSDEPLRRSPPRALRSRLFGYSFIASLSLHALGGVGCLFLYHLSQHDLQGRAQDTEIMVSFVPLSALETNLPLGHLNPTQKDAQAQPSEPTVKTKPKRPEPSSIVEAKKEKRNTQQDDKEPAVETQDSDAPRASARMTAFGVASGTGDSSEPIRISYQDMVATKLAHAKRYPERALRRHTTGEGAIRIKISAAGEVADFEIVRSTESPILDEELKEMVERAAPFPPFPSDLRKESLAIVIPVSFQLKH